MITRRPRVFFPFFGSKLRSSADLYPRPKHELIVEPFAGSAGYSVRYGGEHVVLCDLDPVIAGVWDYLIKVSENEILCLPDVGHGQTVDDLGVPQEARWLIGFWLNPGSATPKKSPCSWMRSGVRSYCYWGAAVRKRLAEQIKTIRSWRVFCCDYRDCPVTGRATWFVDPPYQNLGKHYRFGANMMLYGELARWCRSLKGQVMVCESEGADWLPFRTIGAVWGGETKAQCGGGMDKRHRVSADELKQLLDEYGHGAAITLAEMVGCSASHIRQCARGECRLSLELSEKIRALPPVSSWAKRPRAISGMCARDVKRIVDELGGFSETREITGIPVWTLKGYAYGADRITERAAHLLRGERRKGCRRG